MITITDKKLASLAADVTHRQQAHDERFAALVATNPAYDGTNLDSIVLEHEVAMEDAQYAIAYNALTEAKRLSYDAQEQARKERRVYSVARAMAVKAQREADSISDLAPENFEESQLKADRLRTIADQKEAKLQQLMAQLDASA